MAVPNPSFSPTRIHRSSRFVENWDKVVATYPPSPPPSCTTPQPAQNAYPTKHTSCLKQAYEYTRQIVKNFLQFVRGTKTASLLRSDSRDRLVLEEDSPERPTSPALSDASSQVSAEGDAVVRGLYVQNANCQLLELGNEHLHVPRDFTLDGGYD